LQTQHQQLSGFVLLYFAFPFTVVCNLVEKVTTMIWANALPCQPMAAPKFCVYLSMNEVLSLISST
jgi:hypothetical protein